MWDIRLSELLTWASVLAIVDVILAVGVTLHAVQRKRDGRSVIGWVGLAWLAPILGACTLFAVVELHLLQPYL